MSVVLVTPPAWVLTRVDNMMSKRDGHANLADLRRSHRLSMRRRHADAALKYHQLPRLLSTLLYPLSR